MTNILATSLQLRNYVQKLLGKQKNLKSVKTEIVPFIPKQDPHQSDIYRNKVLSDIGDTSLYSQITNASKVPINVDFSKTEQSFRFVWFEEFPWVYYSR